MTGFIAEIDPRAEEAAQEAASGGNGTFPPLPAGKYQATVVDIEGVKDFGGTGANSQKKVLKVQLRIVDNSPTGARRTYFDRVPLFTRYAPNEKNPAGAPARGFWDFFEKAVGWPRERLIANDLPGVADIQGKQITVTLSAPLPPDSYNPLGFNEVSFYDAAGDVSSTPTNPVSVPWLDATGNLAGGVAPAAPAAPQQSAAPAAPPVWGVPQAPVAPAPPAPQQAVAPVAPAGPPVWNPAADVAGAQALAPASGF